MKTAHSQIHQRELKEFAQNSMDLWQVFFYIILYLCIEIGKHFIQVEKTSAYQIINKKWREDEKCGLYEIQLFKLPILTIALVKKSGYKDVFKQKYVFVYVLKL